MVTIANSAPTRPAWTTSTIGAKAYHATGEWGKRGMTLQELTRAFDAFNEHEERMAIGLAWSEDYLRKLEEPLSDVKTVFSDLDGLRPSFPPETPSPSFSTPTTPVSYHQHSTIRPKYFFRAVDEFGCTTIGVKVSCSSGDGKSNPTSKSPPEIGNKLDEDTIKPTQKRRPSLSAISPATSSPDQSEEECGEFDVQLDECELVEELPARPPSRLAFFDRDADDDDPHLLES